MSDVKRIILLAGATMLLTGSVALAQNLSPGVMDVGKLAAAHVPEDNIVNFVKASGIAYHLTPDDIIYLNGQGVTANVLALMQNSAPAAPAPEAAPAGPPPTPAPPPPDASAAPAPVINLPYFQAQLGPYGTWVDLPPYGPVWRPGAAMNDPGWHPYCQGGHWVMTDAGWYWQADDPWGAVVFHYGRWRFDENNGWVWVPGYNWAPSWVAWRRSDGFYGWAPLPPHAEFVAGVGIAIGGVAVAADFDFGLHASAFTFVGFDHLWEHDYGVVMLPSARIEVVFGASIVQNSYHLDHGRFVVEGFGRDDVRIRTGRAVEVVSINKQVVVEHTTVVNNVSSVKNVSIRNNVTTVRNVTNEKNVSNVSNVKNVSNVNNTKNVSNTRNVNDVNNTKNVNNVNNTHNVNNQANVRNTGGSASTATHPATAPYPAAASHPGTAGAPAAQHPGATGTPAPQHPGAAATPAKKPAPGGHATNSPPQR